jgi:hypothetical protein
VLPDNELPDSITLDVPVSLPPEVNVPSASVPCAFEEILDVPVSVPVNVPVSWLPVSVNVLVSYSVSVVVVSMAWLVSVTVIASESHALVLKLIEPVIELSTMVVVEPSESVACTPDVSDWFVSLSEMVPESVSVAVAVARPVNQLPRDNVVLRVLVSRIERLSVSPWLVSVSVSMVVSDSVVVSENAPVNTLPEVESVDESVADIDDVSLSVRSVLLSVYVKVSDSPDVDDTVPVISLAVVVVESCSVSVLKAEDWRWSNWWHRQQDTQVSWLSPWPLAVPEHWLDCVNGAQTEGELAALRRSVARGAPYGDARWQEQTALALGLQSALRRPGRPRKETLTK